MEPTTDTATQEAPEAPDIRRSYYLCEMEQRVWLDEDGEVQYEEFEHAEMLGEEFFVDHDGVAWERDDDDGWRCLGDAGEYVPSWNKVE